MTANKVTFILGFQGVGKSVYIEENYPDAVIVDYEYWWQNQAPGMTWAESATWVKLMAQAQLIYLARNEYPQIVVECTGLTKVNQAGVRAMMIEPLLQGYEIEIVYLHPVSESDFRETLWNNPGALQMFDACIAQRNIEDPESPYNKWRQPNECPYFANVKTVEIDHGAWTAPTEPAVFAIEEMQ